MTQISNYIYCADFLINLDIKTKILPNPYYDYPYMIIENFFDEFECELVNKKIKDDDDFEKAKILVSNNIISSKIKEEIRKTNIYSLNEKLLEIYTNKFLKFQKEIEDYFKLALTTSTNVQVLEYLKDSFYMMHSDDSSMLLKNDEIVGFVPVMTERKLSTVLFTTSHKKNDPLDGFEGGELLFNFLYNKNGKQIKVEPKAGDMLVFLSNPYFTHEVLKVKKGRRITLVQWHNALTN